MRYPFAAHALSIGLAVTLSGCLGDPGAEELAEETQTETSALSSAIHGIACGMSYYRNGRVVGANCDNVDTLSWAPPYNWPFDRQVDGDLGAPNGAGFYHQSWHLDNFSDPNRIPFPPGTVCGFKETCNNRTETCMGFDAKLQCPPGDGWTRRFANDMAGPSGCGFVWCEYRDPASLCLNGSCLSSMPKGFTCGMTDPDYNATGTCLGLNTKTQGCPAGFALRGFYDAGRSAGHGLGWCEKL